MRRGSEPHTFGQRLDQQRLRLQDQLARMPDGQQRDTISVQIERLQAAAEMHDFLMLRKEAAAAR
jgi:anaerobic glycerol-3-phosphate dehydrogenase